MARLRLPGSSERIELEPPLRYESLVAAIIGLHGWLRSHFHAADDAAYDIAVDAVRSGYDKFHAAPTRQSIGEYLPFWGYVYTAAWHGALNYQVSEDRADARNRAFEEERPHPATPADHVLADERTNFFQYLLTKLSDEERKVLELNCIRGMKPRAIANLLGIPARRVSDLLTQAKKRLAPFVADYEEQGIVPPDFRGYLSSARRRELPKQEYGHD